MQMGNKGDKMQVCQQNQTFHTEGTQETNIQALQQIEWKFGLTFQKNTNLNFGNVCFQVCHLKSNINCRERTIHILLNESYLDLHQQFSCPLNT